MISINLGIDSKHKIKYNAKANKMVKPGLIKKMFLLTTGLQTSSLQSSIMHEEKYLVHQ